MASELSSPRLSDLLITTKDGDWGKDRPEPDTVPYRVIRGADFPAARIGDIAEIPRCYLKAETVHRRTLQAGDIIIETAGGNRDRPTGRTLLITQRLLDSLDLPATCASFCRFLRVNQELAEPRYIFWFLQWLYARGSMWEHQVQHTGVARFQYTRFAATTVIPLPERVTQQAIACILGALDEKIELNRRMNRTLEAMTRAIYKNWFVDFAPVRAKAAGGQPPGLAPDLAAFFPDAFHSSDIGEIPQGWGIQPIGDLVQVLGGGTPSTKEPAYWNGGVHPFCTPRDMSSLSSHVLLQTERHLTDEGLAKVSSGALPAGTVLLSSRAPIGYLAIAETPVSINQGIIAMVCDRELPNLFVLDWTQANMDRVIANANGSTFLEISKQNFRPIKALVPPKPLLDHFCRITGPLYRRLVANLRQVDHLAAIRDALLPRLVSGDLQIPDADRIVGRCA